MLRMVACEKPSGSEVVWDLATLVWPLVEWSLDSPQERCSHSGETFGELRVGANVSESVKVLFSLKS